MAYWKAMLLSACLCAAFITPLCHASVLQYHNGPRRNGFYTDPLFTPANIAGTALDTSFNVTVAGPVYAQPLYLSNATDGRDYIIVATEQATVLAIDAATGQTVWETTLGTPVPLSALPCGDIDPLGITGTPVIDPDTLTIYLDSALWLNNNTNITHQIFAISAIDGIVEPGWPVDVEYSLSQQGITFPANIQNQRGGLTLMDGTVYVPYGGLDGDCGPYHGVVVGIDTTNSSVVQAWLTAGLKGGAWNPSGLANDGHYVYVGTGNTDDAEYWSGGEAVIKLEPGPVFTNDTTDWFAPSNWQALDAADTDIGSSGPMLIDVPNSQPSALAVEMGKNGVAYLLNRTDLGGLSNGVFSATVGSKVIINAPNNYNSTTGQFMSFITFGSGQGCPNNEDGNLVGLKINSGSPPSYNVSWCAQTNGTGSAAAVSPDGATNTTVWVVASEQSNTLRAYNGDTGALLFDSATSGNLTAFARYQTPIAANGRIYAVSNSNLYAFKVANAPTSATAPTSSTPVLGK